MMSDWILDVNSPAEPFKAWAGGKASNMAKLSTRGFQVPPWFCVSALAYDAFIEKNGLQELVKPKPPFAAFSAQLEEVFLKSPLPEELKHEIEEKLIELGLLDKFVAVRSSGLDEDSAENSFAGQFSSFLFQKGWEQIADSVKRCWASGFSERALSYRLERGLPLNGIRVGVVIQKMVNADTAGVVFSRHPIKVMNRDEILISSVWGLGEGLVSGELESDNFEFNRRTQFVAKDVVAKSHAFRQAPLGGLSKEELEEQARKSASLTDAQIAEVAALSHALEDQLGAPQDSEWVYEENKLYVVQTRPITSLPPEGFYDPKVNGENPILWDNSNIIESYSGVTSPLTFSFASRTYRQVYVQFCALMGVPPTMVEENEPTFRNMLGLIRGRIYYNLLNWYRLVLMLPGSSSNKGFMDTMMGVKSQVKPEHKGMFEAVQNPPQYSLLKKANLFALTLIRFLRIDSIVGTFHAHFNRIYNEARKQDFTKLSLPELGKYYFYLEDQLLKRWHAPIINDYLCMLFFGVLKKLTEKWITKEDGAGSLQNDLLCGEGGLESTEPTKCLMRIAAYIDEGDPEFRKWFIEQKSDAIWAALSSKENSSKVHAMLLDFLDRYGFRCVNELKLEEPDLHDDPSFVITSIASYIRTKSYSIAEMEKREGQIRVKAETEVRNKIGGIKLAIYFWVLKHARKAVKNRENLRFGRTKVFGVTRHLFRAVGKHLTAIGSLAEPRDVFYLTVEEIIAFIEGRTLTGDLKTIVANRKAEFQEYLDTPPPPDRFVSFGAVGASLNHTAVLAEGDLMRNEKPESDDPNVLIGTPCCPGIIEGVVRVVKDLKDAEGLNGEILVAGRTDPGWVPLYPSCSGLLIERGSLLSHSAVVARELGLPTIVGISGGLMTRLKTGDRVRVDAGKGEIRILEGA